MLAFRHFELVFPRKKQHHFEKFPKESALFKKQNQRKTAKKKVHAASHFTMTSISKKHHILLAKTGISGHSRSYYVTPFQYSSHIHDIESYLGVDNMLAKCDVLFQTHTSHLAIML